MKAHPYEGEKPFPDQAAHLIAEEGVDWDASPPPNRPPLAPPFGATQDRPAQEGNGVSEPPTAAPFDYAATPVEVGRTLIEASAGTGKTFALAGLVLRLVLDPSAGSLRLRSGTAGPAADALAGADGLPDLRRLLVVTFTVAATEELKTRIRGALRTALRVARGEAAPDDLTRPLAPLLARPGAEARLLAALDRVDEAGIFTIHGFCKRVLEQAAFESGTPFATAFVEDAGALVARASADAWARLVHDAPWLATLAVRLGWTPAALAGHHDAVTRFPNTEILPPAPPLADALDALRDATKATCACWDPAEVLALLEGLVWTAKAPFDSARLAEVVARVAACAEDPAAVETARMFTPAALTEALHGARKVNRERLPQLAAHPAFAACAGVEKAVEALRIALVHAFTGAVAERLAANKERAGVLTFDDLLTRLHDALHDAATGPALAAGIRRQFAVALVDEFQDTDPVQYAIFRTAFAGRPLFFVGDPKQAIYGFRGADIHAYLRAQREADRRYTLGTNWRSAARLVGAVNALFGGAARPFLYGEIGFHAAASPEHRAAAKLVDGDRPPLIWWTIPPAENGQRQPKGEARGACLRATVREIRRLLAEARLDGRRVAPSDCAVLVRSNRQAQEMQDALRRAGVPAVISRAGDIREAPEMADVEVLLHAVARPDDGGALRAALATELWGWTAADLARLDDAPDALDDLRRGLRELQRVWRRHGILRVLTQFQEQEGVAARLLACPDGERRMTNLRHVVELLHEAERAADRSPEALLHWLRHRRELQLGARDKAELRLERDADAVQITTVHNAKGLEYEVVFLPYLWDVHAKDYDADFTGERPPLVHLDDGRVVYDLGSEQQDAHRKLREVERLAEFLRLAYVGLTRARERCYVAWGAANEAHRSALGYLLDGHTAAGDDDAQHVERARVQAKAADPFANLSALVLAHPDLMAIEEVPDGPIPPPEASGEADDAAQRLHARALPEAAARRTQAPWRTHSFSAWAAARRRDDDATLAASDEPEASTRRTETPETGLHAFAAGAAPGTCLHEILQYARYDCPETDEAARHNAELVRRALERHGLADRRRHRAPLDPHAEVLALVRRAARAPLLGGARLGDCKAGHRWAEWRFVFPVVRVAPRALAEAFRAHAAPPFDGDYADRLAALSDDAVDGFMTGIADLVACHDDGHGPRWWVLDWKSNWLGPDDEAYGADALVEAMRAHHYGLQLHLYALGLHRHLRARLGEAYDYDRDVGGAAYVFLRGLRDDAPEAGLLRHRPPRALVEVLDRLLRGDA